MLVADVVGTALGLTAENVMEEYRNWRNESYRYDSSTKYPWRHPVLYHICTDMRRIGVERQMTPRELEGLAATLLAKWEARVADGTPIPPVRLAVAPPRHPAGPTPAQVLKAQAEAAKLKRI